MSMQQRREVERLMREAPLDFGGDLAEQRGVLEAIMTSHPLADDVTMRATTLGGVPVVEIEVDGTGGDAVILYLHGGAYTMGSAAAAAGLASELGRRARTRVVSVDYRLAPEYPYPAALKDAIAAYRGLLESGVEPEDVVIAGESAGGGLAIALVSVLAEHGLPQPACTVVLSPWADLTLSGESVVLKGAVDPSVDANGLRRRAADYVGSADPRDPHLSPVFADLHGTAPLLVQVGGNEVLLDDATRLAASAARAGVEVTLEVTPDVPHVFQAFAEILEEGDRALERAGRFIAEHVRGGEAARAY